MELYNRHRFVYETIIVGIFTYLIEVLPTGALEHPDILLEAARTKNSGKSLSQMHGNFLVLLDIALPMLYRALLLGLEVLLRFLFDFGFPWLFFRRPFAVAIQKQWMRCIASQCCGSEDHQAPIRPDMY